MPVLTGFKPFGCRAGADNMWRRTPIRLRFAALLP